MVNFHHSPLSSSASAPGSNKSRQAVPFSRLPALNHPGTANHHGIRHCNARNNGTAFYIGADQPCHYSLNNHSAGRDIVSSTICLSSEKPIVRTPRPQDFNRQLLSLTAREANRKSLSKSTTPFSFSQYHKDAQQRRWTTTTKVATEEYALPTPRNSVPTTTLEPCADSVRYRARETNQKPLLWQTYTREWDMKQLRHPAQKLGINLPAIPKNCAMVQLRNKTENQPNLTRQLNFLIDSNNCNCIKDDLSLFTRPMPGYGGFVPHHPVDPKPITDMDCVTASMCSTSRRTYRSYPPEEYKELTFAHRGPLSKTITLTAPFNPFNKVEQC